MLIVNPACRTYIGILVTFNVTKFEYVRHLNLEITALHSECQITLTLRKIF